MKPNDMKKGTLVILQNGWRATIVDNMRGTIRIAKVYGYATEIGSIYVRDIGAVLLPAEDGELGSSIGHPDAVPGVRYTLASLDHGKPGRNILDL